MKKYIVTDKHELILPGIVLKSGNDKYYISSGWSHLFSSDEIDEWLDDEWIEELVEK